MRSFHDDPVLPDDVTPDSLDKGARNELKTLTKENAEWVARHLAMASRLIEDDPALAHAHAVSASRRAGRIAIVRETLAITAYTIGDYALALRELRTYRRISGKDDQIALMVDSERGVGRSDRALELGRSVDRTTLPTQVRVELAIAMSGARLDLGEPERALTELDIPELDPDRAFAWSPALFAARASVLEELGRSDEAEQWRARAEVAEDALGLNEDEGSDEVIVVEEVFEAEEIAGGDADDDEASDEDFDEASDEDSEATEDSSDDATNDGSDDAPFDAEEYATDGASQPRHDIADGEVEAEADVEAEPAEDGGRD
nr:hypothetical protein [Microbacterium lemovicicum]